MGVLFKINLRWLMFICSRLSDLNGEKLVGMNHHDDVPLVTEWRQLLGLISTYLLAIVHIPAHLLLLQCFSVLAAHWDQVEGL